MMDTKEGDDMLLASENSYADLEGFSVADGEEDDHQNYIVLEEKDIRGRLEDNLNKVSSVLSVSKDAALSLLRRYNWNINKVHEEWFTDEESVRKSLGLLKKPNAESSNCNYEFTCGICFDIYSSDEISFAGCDHPYCKSCWEGYITTSIDDGPGCLKLKCPEPSCNAAVGLGMIAYLARDKYKIKYRRYLVRSYVEESPKIKWCPAPGCEYAVEFVLGRRNYDVVCGCLNEFCWNCTEDAHRPVDCDMVAKWALKNKKQSENSNCILAFTKPCPKCNRPIEKNEGCMLMTCIPPCGHRFCWLCLKSWSWGVHDYSTCNGYKKSEQVNETQEGKKRTKRYSVRYTHYYERWVANERSKQKALEDLRNIENVKLSKLSQILNLQDLDLKFLVDAWRQIVECRRVLKWTYTYGYYLPENEYNKTQLFEYVQGEAEACLERLHQCAEKELKKYLKTENPNCGDFRNFRRKLVNLTIVTGNYFENLVRALENGLSDVDSGGCNRKRGSSDNVSEAESKKPVRRIVINR